MYNSYDIQFVRLAKLFQIIFRNKRFTDKVSAICQLINQSKQCILCFLTKSRESKEPDITSSPRHSDDSIHRVHRYLGITQVQ